MYICDSEIKVRYVETDQMGIVHHSNYYHWFEISRGDYIEKIDLSYYELEKMGLLMPIVETACKYREPARYGDIIIVKSRIAELGRAKIVFEYQIIRKDDDKLLAEGKTVQAIVNKEFQVINLKKTHNQIYEKLLQYVGDING